jgi:hypothetical protein
MNTIYLTATKNWVRAFSISAFLMTTVAIMALATPPSSLMDETSQGAVGLEASMLRSAGPQLQRSAPVTWSSRFNVRMEARWGVELRYMV